MGVIKIESGRILVDLAQELERQIAIMQDLVLASSLLQCRIDGGCKLKLIVDAENHVASGGVRGGGE